MELQPEISKSSCRLQSVFDIARPVTSLSANNNIFLITKRILSLAYSFLELALSKWLIFLNVGCFPLRLTMIPLQSPRLALQSVSPTTRAVRAQAPTLATLANPFLQASIATLQNSYSIRSWACFRESTIHSHPNSQINSNSNGELDQSLHEASSQPTQLLTTPYVHQRHLQHSH